MTFQKMVRYWVVACFGEEVAFNVTERCHRFMEEGLELVQSLGCTKQEVMQLVDYVFSRPKGLVRQELGGAMTTLHALANATHLDAAECGEEELERNWRNREKIRAKWLNKPKFGPLPEQEQAKLEMEMKQVQCDCDCSMKCPQGHIGLQEKCWVWKLVPRESK